MKQDIQHKSKNIKIYKKHATSMTNNMSDFIPRFIHYPVWIVKFGLFFSIYISVTSETPITIFLTLLDTHCLAAVVFLGFSFLPTKGPLAGLDYFGVERLYNRCLRIKVLLLLFLHQLL